MSFWDRLSTGLGRLFGQSSQGSQSDPTRPDSDNAPETGPRESGGFWGAVFGARDSERNPNISSSEAEQAERNLDAFAPEDRSQGLFYLGWVDKNVSKDVRSAARRRWEQEYGEWNPRKGRKTMKSEDWAKWRQYVAGGSP